ncbi:MAG: TldD/PmbA family protein, partial [Hyphomicrobiales bacterium]|nr:TldD/PmbA family protein [Hyphomicrobiales bacterium]
AGADAADAVTLRGVSLGVEVRLGKVEETERAESDNMGLRVFVGARTATVSTNAMEAPDVLAERAVAMARVAPEDPFAGLADADLLARDFPDLDVLDRSQPDAAELTEAALAAEAAALAVDGVTNSGGASANWSLGGMVLVTSNGFSGRYLASSHSRSAMAVAGEGTAMERDYDYTVARFREDLMDVEAVGRNAGERAVRRLKPKKVASRTLDIVYEPRAAASLLYHFAGAISGAAIARGTSFLKDRKGEQVFAPGVRIVDDPLRRRGLRSRPFDGEGIASAAIDLIADGVLTDWLLDLASARELGLTSNGRARRGTGSAPAPGSTNLALMPGDVGAEEMISNIREGIYVTDLIGHGDNLVTGDYSRGAAGFWIENGEITYPVSEITIAGNLADMFRRLTPASDFEYRYGVDAPTVLIEGMTVAGE